HHYNTQRPHSALNYKTPEEYREEGHRAVEKPAPSEPWKTLRVSHFPTAPATATIMNSSLREWS
ncbi:MAG: hypothetical protein ACRD1R_07395, partial [Acidobacteriota bacterium]